MGKEKHCLIALLSGVLLAAAVLSGCGQSKKEASKNNDHLTVYLWENRLIKNIEYSCAVTPQVRQTGNRLSGLAGTAYASLLA